MARRSRGGARRGSRYRPKAASRAGATTTGASLRSYLEGTSLLERTVNFLSAFKEVKLLALAVTATNIAGVAYGIYYYWHQLNETVWYLLPFVPDSPTGPFLMIVIFGLWWFAGKRRSPVIELLAFVELVKYGIWTVVVFWLYRDAFFSPARVELTNTLLILHLAEALEAGVLLKGMRVPTLPMAAFAAGWLALGDFCDYGLGALSTHPTLPAGIDPALATATVPVITVGLTIICYLAAIVLARFVGSPRPRAEAAPDAPPPPLG